MGRDHVGDALVHVAALAAHEAGPMIGHRDGHTVTICDGCYRPHRLVQVGSLPLKWVGKPEPGWEHSDEGGYPEALGRSEGRNYVQPEQGLDYCPRCVAARTSITR